MTLFDVYPLNDITIVKAKGSYVWDDKDQKYLDMYGGHAVISIGHTHPHYVKRLQEQLHKVVSHDQHQHGKRKQRNIAEKAAVTRVIGHVADGVDMHHE